MGVDEHTDHAQGPVELDEPHPPHVAGEVVNFIASLHHPVAGLFFLKIQNMILGIFMNLIPLIQALDIGDHHLVALRQQRARKVPADEASAPRN